MIGLGLAMGGFGIIFMLLFWIGLIMLAVWIAGLLFPKSQPQNTTGSAAETSAEDILNRRYARGELTAEQYRDMLTAIRH